MVNTLDQSLTPRQWEKLRAELAEIEFVRTDVLLQRGREEGARHLLLRLLNKKFPSVKEWEPLLQQIENVELLEQLAGEVLENDNARQILRRVKAAAKGQ